MHVRIRRKRRGGAIAFIFACAAAPAGAANIAPNAFAWSENAGWINFAPNAGPGVNVGDIAVTGFAWSENLGWINLAPIAGGVVNDRHGNLYGYAWGENAGWIHFAPNGVPVGIDANGAFSGFAWGENVGWINFNAAPGVSTSWRASDVIFANGFDVLPTTPFLAIDYVSFAGAGP